MNHKEVRYLAIAIVCALILVLSHLIMSKQYIDTAWSHYLLALAPFVLGAIGYYAIRSEIRAQDEREAAKND